MSDPVAARRRALEQCIVLRFKLIELTNLLALSHAIADGYVPPKVLPEFRDTMLTTLLAYTVVCLNAITDEHSLDIRNVIRVLYPDEKAWLKEIWTREVQPAMSILRQYRNKAVAHADNIADYLQTRFDYDLQGKAIGLAANGLLAIVQLLIKRQDAEPEEFHVVAEEVILEADLKNLRHKLNRIRLKHMGILPSGNFHKVY